MKLKIWKPKMPSLRGRELVTDVFAIVGWVLMLRGVAMISEPAAWILAGLWLMAAAILLQKPAKAT